MDPYEFSVEGFYDPERGPAPLRPEEVRVAVVACRNPVCSADRRPSDESDPEADDICPACEGYGVQLDVARGQEALVLLMAAMEMYGAAPEYVEADGLYDDIVEKMATLLQQITPSRAQDDPR